MRSLLAWGCLLSACQFNADTERNAGDPGPLPGAADADPSAPDADPSAPDARPADSVDAAPLGCFEPIREVDVSLDIESEQTCAIWNSLDFLEGTTIITRNGNQISIDFGDGVAFTGTISVGAVTLTYSHQHSFSDNCTWQADELLVGTLTEGEDCDLSLTYSYSESVAVSDGNCAIPCDAFGNIDLSITPIEID